MSANVSRPAVDGSVQLGRVLLGSDGPRWTLSLIKSLTLVTHLFPPTVSHRALRNVEANRTSTLSGMMVLARLSIQVLPVVKCEADGGGKTGYVGE